MTQWHYQKLAELTTKVGSGSTPRGGKASYHTSGVPLIRSLNVHFDGFRYDGLAYLNEKQASALAGAEVHGGDVLLNITGASIGRVTVAPTALNGARVNQHVCIIRPREPLDQSFLRWYLASPATQKLILNVQSGATRQALTKEKILDLDVPVPPLDQQHRIVAEIEKQFSRLDEAVANLKRVKANLKRYRAAVLKAAVEGKLTEEWRKQHPDIEHASGLFKRILADRRAKWNGKGDYKEPASRDSSELVSVPGGWALATLEQLTSAARVICYGILMPKEHVANGVLYVKVKDMKGDRVDVASLQRTSPKIAAAYARASLKTGDLLLAIRGTYGRVAEVPAELNGGNITQDTARLDVSPLMDRRYVAIHLRSQVSQGFFRRVARGVAVKGVNIGDVRLTPIGVPPLNEQKQIVAEVDRRVSVIDELESVVYANLVRAERLRQSALAQAFNGRPPSNELQGYR